MLKLLLDEHISPRVAKGLHRKYRWLTVHFMTEWDNGRFIGQDDSACLEHAEKQGQTLVTYDRRTIPLLLKAWAEAGRKHGGVVFVDEKTISPSDIGGQVRAFSKVSERGWGLGLVQPNVLPATLILSPEFG